MKGFTETLFITTSRTDMSERKNSQIRSRNDKATNTPCATVTDRIAAKYSCRPVRKPIAPRAN